jgi:bile acid-coenzyme A ligase
VRRSDDLAVDLGRRGVGVGHLVTVALPNSVEWYIAYAAIWRLGGTPQPVSSHLPARELEAILQLADPPVVLGAPAGSLPGRVCLPVGYQAPAASAEELSALPDAVSPAWKAPTSGGSTGAPKLIVSGDPALTDPDADPPMMLGREGTMVMPGPLYHNAPGSLSSMMLIAGGHVVLLPRFDAEATLAAVDEHQATVLYLVPRMMKRIWRLPEGVRNRYDLSTLRVVWHMAEPCPDWLKQAWIDWLGAERILELYGGTEGQSATVITGTEWLAHRGSVGHIRPGALEITDAYGEPAPTGQMGEIWLRSVDRDTPAYHYLGAQARSREGGWESLGDMGYLDEDGYLYLGDRSSDMILSGGANIYPAEIEAALQEHRAVRSCAVIGLPDDDKGNVVHAIVEATPTDVSVEELLLFLRERLSIYKLPRTVEFVDIPLRDDAGKLRRSALRAQRLPQPTTAKEINSEQ